MALHDGKYLNIYFPVCESYGWEGGPEFSTQIVTLQNGREFRNENFSVAQHRYTTNFQNISKEAANNIRKVFYACRGRSRVFRYIDALDSEATKEDFAVGDGTRTTFQIGKFTVLDGVEYFRYVYALRSFTLYVDDVEITSGFTVDMNRGTITFDTAPANNAVLSWTGEFDIWVRFDSDYLPFTLDNVDATNTQVNLLEMPPPPPDPVAP